MFDSFFIWCSGASKEILAKCPESEHIRQRNIGTFVFLTGIIAFFTSTYALLSIFDELESALLGGVLWASLIFNLDCFLVSTTPIKKVDENYKLLKRYIIPRVILASFIGIAIGTPFEMYIFKDEINTQIKDNELYELNEKYLKNIEKIKTNHQAEKNLNGVASDCVKIAQNINNIENQIKGLEEERTFTATGKDGTAPKCGIRCQGRISEIKEYEKSLNKNKSDLELCNKPLQDEINTRNEKFKNEQKIILDKSLLEAPKYSLLEQYTALSSLAATNGYIFWARWFFILMFVFFEIAPIFAKFMGGASNHDLFVYQEKEKVEIETNDNKDKVMSSLTLEKIRIEGEKAKLAREWDIFHTSHQSFLDKFSEVIKDKWHEVLDEWSMQFDSDPQIQQADEHFREHFKESLSRFSEFATRNTNTSTPSDNTAPPNNDTTSPSNTSSKTTIQDIFENKFLKFFEENVGAFFDSISEKIKSNMDAILMCTFVAISNFLTPIFTPENMYFLMPFILIISLWFIKKSKVLSN